MLSEVLDGIDLTGVPGVTIGVVSGKSEAELIFSGYCSREGDRISAQTLWEVASLTKPVVALLALTRLAEDHELLERPLVTTAADFGATDPILWGQLTLWHALTHSTGLPNWRDEGRPLVFESDPGTPGYSGEGFELLLTELSACSGLTAESLVAQHLRRLDMTDSSFTPHLDAQSGVAIGHLTSGQPVAKHHPDCARASGSLHATARDYLRFLSAVARPDDLPDRDLRDAAGRMGRREVEIIPGHGKTLGWAFTTTDRGDVLWQHGDNPGFKHVAAVRPATHEAVVVFTNGDDGQNLYRPVCKRVLQVEVW